MVRGFTQQIAWVWWTSVTSLVSAAATVGGSITVPIVDLGYARYQGHFDMQKNITQYLGVRYAAPPVGKLRFQAPQPPVPVSGVQPARENPNMCYQFGFGSNVTAMLASEDCLFLNVFVPGKMTTEPVTSRGLPVVVWIHGGGYEWGYAAQYNGADLVVDSLNSVVVVVIQYRLGAFGFLSGKEVKAHGTLNAGILDQNFALEWVRQYIGLFDGDKDHVTIWGESSGAGSVLQHIIANGGKTQPPLFHAAITSSLYLPSQYHYDDQVPQMLYDGIVVMAGCALSTDTFACLQSVEAKTLQTASYNIAASTFHDTSLFVPVVDDTFIHERPTVALAKGQLNGHVLLSITNRNEGTEFVHANETLTIADYVSRLFPKMTPHQVREAAYVYRDYGTAVEQAATVIGDSILVCPTYYLLKAFAGRSWKGLFAIPPAEHTADVTYYFRDSPPFNPFYNNSQFITAFAQSFMSLSKYYDVNTKFDPTNITPYWNDYYIGETEMLFNRTEGGVPAITPIKTDPAVLQRCAFWESMTPATVQ